MTTALCQRVLQDLQLAGLSERTQEAYLRAVRQFADYFHTPSDRLSEQQVRDYFLHLKNGRIKIESRPLFPLGLEEELGREWAEITRHRSDAFLTVGRGDRISSG